LALKSELPAFLTQAINPKFPITANRRQLYRSNRRISAHLGWNFLYILCNISNSFVKFSHLKTKLERGCFIFITMDQIKFLRDTAYELRKLAQRAPSIAEGLLRLADELEARAADLEAKGRPPSGEER
jgi:hypothetical protein